MPRQNLTVHRYVAAVADGEIDLIPLSAGFSPKRYEVLDFSPVTNYMDIKIITKRSKPGEV